MRYTRIALLALTVVIFVAPVSSTLDSSVYSAEYGESVTVTIEDANGGETRFISYGISACGENVAAGGARSINLPIEVSFNIPQDVYCSVGAHTISASVSDGSGSYDAGSADLNVYAKGSMDEHVGKYLYTNLVVTADKCTFSFNSDCVKREELRHFFLSDDQITSDNWDSDDFNNNAQVLLKNPGGGWGDNTKGYKAKEGGIAATYSSLGGLVDTNVNCVSVSGTTESTSPCGVWMHSFVTSNKYEPKNTAANAPSITPLHDSGNFMPEGDIIFGNYPEYYTSSMYSGINEGSRSQDSDLFFICRDGAKMSNGYGEEIPQVVEANGQLYQCDLSNNEWVEVSQCQDGLDNDGDASADHPNANVVDYPSPDASCASQTDTETGPDAGDCTPAAAYNGTNYVAYYGGFPDSDGYCDGSDGKKQTFAEWTASLEGGSAGTPPDATVHTCDDGAGHSYCENKDYYIHDEDLDKSGAQIYYAKYYPTEGYLQDVIPYDLGTIYGEKTESYFVNGSGWTPARMALDGSSFSGEGTKPSLRQGAERIYGAVDASTHRHSDSFWFNTKGMVDGDGNGYQDGSYDDSWVVANAGAPNNDQVSSEFPGGWAGKCPQGTEWRKESGSSGQEWRCSGEPDWKQAVFLPQITQGTNKIGIIVMPYNFKDVDAEPTSVINLGLSSWKTAYDGVADNTATSDETLDQMKVSCYPGETAPDYSTATEGQDYFNETVSIPGTDVENPVGVSGTVDMSGHSTYTCEWSYTTAGGEKVNGIGCVIELQNSDSECVGNFGDIKDYYMGTEGSDPVEFPDGTVLERDTKYSSEQVTELTN